ncbi:MAG: hypothetical protein ACFFBH_13005 [Promethearchaeota archaeon]
MKKKGLFIIGLLLLIFFIAFNHNIRLLKAQPSGSSLPIQNKFAINEFSNVEGKELGVKSVNITLPSTEWNISKIKMNFTDMEFNKEIFIGEDQKSSISDYFRVYYQNINQYRYGLGVQIKLFEPAIIYGAYIYGYKLPTTTTVIQVQIRGYNSIANIPNSTVFTTTNINMSTTEGWYLQKFPAPISLPKGNYSLVLYGTVPLNNPYYWFYNGLTSQYTDLYISEYKTSWDSTGSGFGQNRTLLHKLIIKYTTPLYPENINMSVKINDNFYQVINDTVEGNGIFTHAYSDFLPKTNPLEISVYNRVSQNLFFNASFHLNLEKIEICQGSVTVKESGSNDWSVFPILDRQTFNYSAEFYFPISWSNLTLFRNEVEIHSPNVTIDLGHNIMLIPNNTIILGAEWEIKANSPKILFSLNAPKTEYYLGQELQFSLAPPVLEGNYTYILINSADIEEFKIVKTIPPENNIFSYELPLTSPDGNYIAYVYWNNQTDAGVMSQQFSISHPVSPPEDNTLFYIVIFILIAAPILAITAFIAYKRLSRARTYKMQRLLEKCVDILNLNYLIVTDIKSGIDIYSQSFGEQKADSSLISGFLQAVRAFGSEVAADKDKTVKIEYKNSILLMTEFVNVRLILNMKAEPSVDFHYAVESLAYDVYKEYGKLIDDFHGNVKDFQGIKGLVEKHLNVSFIYPLKIENAKVKLTSAEREMVEKAKKLMKDNNLDHFYTLYLLPANECSPKDAQTILNLIEKGVFVTQKP